MFSFFLSLFFYIYSFVNSNCRKLNLLSFGEEAEEEEKELALVKQKIKSSHDVLNDPRLLKEETPNDELVIRPFLKYFYLTLKLNSCLTHYIFN